MPYDGYVPDAEEPERPIPEPVQPDIPVDIPPVIPDDTPPIEARPPVDDPVADMPYEGYVPDIEEPERPLPEPVLPEMPDDSIADTTQPGDFPYGGYQPDPEEPPRPGAPGFDPEAEPTIPADPGPEPTIPDVYNPPADDPPATTPPPTGSPKPEDTSGDGDPDDVVRGEEAGPQRRKRPGRAGEGRSILGSQTYAGKGKNVQKKSLTGQ
jgi:hypothetical protein